jgi:uncharacterized protein YegL
MKMRRIAVVSVFTAGIILLGAAVQGGIVTEEDTISPPRIEVVFVLDTTGSMSGLINAAQEKIWAITSTLCQAEPAPEIAIGLVGYRDRGDEYITRLTSLTPDLDRVYSDLMEFQAAGGGDSPESVNQALYQAVTGINWSVDNSTYRVIFLVGDCPPHMDYQNDVRYPETCLLAGKKGIIINTIQCGAHGPTTPVWKEIASLAGGEFFRVGQSGSAVLTTTPYDEKLASLSRDLDATRIFYGDAKVRAEQEERKSVAKGIYSSVSDSAAAQRAVFNASISGKDNLLGSSELVDDVVSGEVDLSSIKNEELPEDLRGMKSAERTAYIEEQSKKRDSLQKEIRLLSEKRQNHIRDEVKKSAQGGKETLDYQIYQAIRDQGAAKKISYKKGPVY